MPESRGGLQSNPDKALQRRAQGHMLNLDDAVTLAGWPTPICNDELGSTHCYGSRKIALKLPGAARLAGETPGSSASTAKRGVLNPAFSRWLMGYPAAWDACVPTGTPSSRKSRRSS
jgi:hypothetical protein